MYSTHSAIIIETNQTIPPQLWSHKLDRCQNRFHAHRQSPRRGPVGGLCFETSLPTNPPRALLPTRRFINSGCQAYTAVQTEQLFAERRRRQMCCTISCLLSYGFSSGEVLIPMYLHLRDSLPAYRVQCLTDRWCPPFAPVLLSLVAPLLISCNCFSAIFSMVDPLHPVLFIDGHLPWIPCLLVVGVFLGLSFESRESLSGAVQVSKISEMRDV
jgi:hypothetical protein